jgi:hypothetical protein
MRYTSKCFGQKCFKLLDQRLNEFRELSHVFGNSVRNVRQKNAEILKKYLKVKSNELETNRTKTLDFIMVYLNTTIEL